MKDDAVKGVMTGYLEASETGTAQIVWKQYSTGCGGWGLVRLHFDFGPHRLGFDAIARLHRSLREGRLQGLLLVDARHRFLHAP